MRRGTSSLGTDVPSEREINRLAARSEEEFWLFEKMDEERRQKENYRSRLMEDHEVPEWVYTVNADVTEKGKGFDYDVGKITGKRKRKEVVYADTLSDSRWAKAVENGEVEELYKPKRRSKEPPSSVDELKLGSEAGSEELASPSEGKSEETPRHSPKMMRVDDEMNFGASESRDVGVRDWKGRVLTWNTHKRKRSSYNTLGSMSESSRSQNSGGRGNR